MTPDRPDSYQRGSALSRGFLPLALITLGVVFLLVNALPDRDRGGLFILGLGAAFGLGRVTTGRYGYAVPAGLLIAIGAHVIVIDQVPRGTTSNGGAFFLLLGLGFLLVYLIGMQPARVWPLFPAAILGGLGLVLLGVASLGPLASLSWLAAYWPVALVLIGVWLLFRDSLPRAARAPIALVGAVGLLAYGVVAAGATVAAGGESVRSGIAQSFSPPQSADSITLDMPITAGQTLTVLDTPGTTIVHGGATGSSVHVVANRHYAKDAPDVRLTPSSGGGVTLQSSARRGEFPFGPVTYVDYTVDVPAGVGVTAKFSNGHVQIDGVDGPVDASMTNGALDVSNVSGPVQVRTSNGPITLSEVDHLRQAQTTNGPISVQGVFTETAEIRSERGPVTLKLLPGSNVRVDARTSRGVIQQENLLMTNVVSRSDALTGAVGAPGGDATLRISTDTGPITLSE